jgi:Cu(I)/Ag(I) efflux system membrane protein CusA/SilA
MWSTGTGADVMKRIAAPMVGGLATSFLLELLVYPAVYFLWKRREVEPGPATPEDDGSTGAQVYLPAGMAPAGTGGPHT